MRMRTGRLPGLLAAALLLVAAACGGDDGDNGEDSTGEAAEEPAATVAVTDSPLGSILVDGDGMTLYMFDQDGQGESTCYDGCEVDWLPLVVDGDPVAGGGVVESMLGTVEREDGSIQVTYNDWPLYAWTGDSIPSDTTGQGVDGVWWVIGPNGEPIRDE